MQTKTMLTQKLSCSTISFFIFFALLFSCTTAHASKRVALVIGNSNYSASPLKNPKNDAKDITKALKRLDFKVILATNADKRKMVSSINQFSSALRTADIGFFFYAGHGMQIRGSNYLIPVGVEVKSASDVEFEAVHAGRILGKMEEAGNKLNIVVLDACRNNPFRSYFRSGEKGLAQMNAPIGTVIAYATGTGSVAADGRGRNGLFTKHLLQAINQPGLSVKQMFNQAGLGVMRETERKQVPWLSTTPIEPIYLAGGVSAAENRNQRPVVRVDIGSIKINSNPSGATVFIDGNRAGDTPLELGDMVPASKTIRVEKSGYVSEEKNITIRKDKRSVVRFDLAAEVQKGWLTISPSPADARVRILNISPRYRDNINLDPGRYHVEVSAEGYETKQQWIDLVAGDALDLDFNLQKKRVAEIVQRNRLTGFKSNNSQFTRTMVKDGYYEWVPISKSIWGKLKIRSKNFIEQPGVIVFTGDVDTQLGDVRILSDTLTCHYTVSEEKLTWVGRAEASSGAWLGTAKKLMFLLENRKLLLLGNAKSWHGEKLDVGDSIIYSLATGKFEIINPH